MSIISRIMKRPSCSHKWYIINQFSNIELRNMAEDPRYDPSLQHRSRISNSNVFSEKVCLKCKKYVDQITPRYKYHLEQIERCKEGQVEVEIIVAKARGPEEKIWER